MLAIRHLTAAVLTLVFATTASAQQPPAPSPRPGQSDLLVFLGGKQVGREQVNLARSGGNWILTSTGGMAGQAEMKINRFEVKYAADWQPLELTIEAEAGGKPFGLHTSFGMTTAINEITQAGTTSSKTDQISARAVVLPNNFFAAYEALAVRLAGTAVGSELPLYVAPQTEIKASVRAVFPEQLKGPMGTIDVRRYEMVFQNPTGALSVTVTTDSTHRLVRVEIPAAGLSVVRADLSTVATRAQVARNPTDSDVTIPANGFNLAGTITVPPQVAGRLRHPAVILVPGSGPVDRDANVYGIPIFAQLAGALANQGYLVVRFDKRGVGQSGGRDERATIQDYADDVLSVVRWLRKRKDVDRERLAVAGHSEGGAVSMIAASRTDDIKSLVLIASPGTRGFDLILEQQDQGLDEIEASEEDRKEKIDLQQRIQTAVLTGVGWEGIPPELRKRADSAWFKSLLEFDPAQVMTRVRQPVLIIQGDLDKQVLPHHADKLGEMAKKRKRNAPVEVVHLPGVNHLLVKARTGSVSEYTSLEEKKVVPAVAEKIAEWLRR